MPKKKKKSDKEKEDVLEELAQILKKKNEDGEEEPELANMDFSQFVSQPLETETGSPALERIAGFGTRPIFVGGIPQQSLTAGNGNGESDDFKYVPGTGEDNTPKYLGPQEGTGTPGERIDFSEIGRNQETFPQTDQRAMFERASESRNFSSQNVERFEAPKRLDVREAGRRDPFAREETKYEKYKLKLPDSR
jgi:hypothetical protein